MKNTVENHPSLPTNYVSINDLRDKWLNQQQQQQQQPPQPQQQPEPPPPQQQKSPKKYVTILDLRERWLKKQQEEAEEEQKRKETEKEKEKEKEKEEFSPDFEKPHQLTKSINPNCNVGGKDGELVRKGGHKFRNSRKFKPGNPNLIVKLEKNKTGLRNPNFVGGKDVHSEKNKTGLRNPNVWTKVVNPNLIGEDDEKLEKSEPHTQELKPVNPNPKENGSVKGDELVSEDSGIEGKGEAKAEFGSRCQLKDGRVFDNVKGKMSGSMRKRLWEERQRRKAVESDALTTWEQQRTLEQRMRWNQWSERKKERMNREAQNPVSENHQSVDVGKNEGEGKEKKSDEDVENSNTKKNEEEGEERKSDEGVENSNKEEEGEVSKVDEGGEDSNGEIVAEVNHITGIVVTEKRNTWKNRGYSDGRYKCKRVSEKHLEKTGSYVKEDEEKEKKSDLSVNQITGRVATENRNMWKIKGYTNMGYKNKVTEEHLAIPGRDVENEEKKSENEEEKSDEGVEQSNGEKMAEVNHRKGRVAAKESAKTWKSREYAGRGYNYNYNYNYNYKKVERRRRIEKNEEEGKEKKSDLGVENSNGDSEEEKMSKMSSEGKNVEENDCGSQLKDVQTIKETPRKTENTVSENREPVIEKNVEKVEKGNNQEVKEVKRDEGVADVNQNKWKHRGYTNRRYTHKKVAEKYLPITGSDFKEDEEKKSDEGVENSNEENKRDEGVDENSKEENKSDEGVESLSGETVAEVNHISATVLVTEKQKMWKSRGYTAKGYKYENGSRYEGERVGGGRWGKGRGRGSGDLKPEYSSRGRGGMVNGSHKGEGKKATGSMWVKKA